MDLSNLFFKINYRIVGFRLSIINFILKRFLPNNFKKTFNFNYEVFYNKDTIVTYQIYVLNMVQIKDQMIIKRKYTMTN